jgi:hypothetical protein
MLFDSLAMEHYRLHLIEQWPAGAQKEAALASVHSSLKSLLRGDIGQQAAWTCVVCGRATAAAEKEVLPIAA